MLLTQGIGHQNCKKVWAHENRKFRVFPLFCCCSEIVFFAFPLFGDSFCKNNFAVDTFSREMLWSSLVLRDNYLATHTSIGYQVSANVLLGPNLANKLQVPCYLLQNGHSHIHWHITESISSTYSCLLWFDFRYLN